MLFSVVYTTRRALLITTTETAQQTSRTPTQNLRVPVIAIDGPAGSGKSTAAENTSRKLNFHRLNSGSIYRAITLICIDNGVMTRYENEPPGAIATIARSISIQMKGSRLLIDGRDRTSELRLPEVDQSVPFVAKILEVREVVRRHQIAMRVLPGLVAEGRDLGEIFQNSCRIYLDASAEVRATRARDRLIRGGKLNIPSHQAMLSDIIERDHEDMQRSNSPLAQHPDATVIDTSNLTEDQVLHAVLRAYHTFSGS